MLGRQENAQNAFRETTPEMSPPSQLAWKRVTRSYSTVDTGPQSAYERLLRETSVSVRMATN